MTLLPGSLLRLECSSDLDAPVKWRLTDDVVSGATMTANGALARSFRPLFRIDSTSRYDLVATHAQVGTGDTYCAKYDCVENDGAGATASANVASW